MGIEFKLDCFVSVSCIKGIVFAWVDIQSQFIPSFWCDILSWSYFVIIIILYLYTVVGSDQPFSQLKASPWVSNKRRHRHQFHHCNIKSNPILILSVLTLIFSLKKQKCCKFASGQKGTNDSLQREEINSGDKFVSQKRHLAVRGRWVGVRVSCNQPP